MSSLQGACVLVLEDEMLVCMDIEDMLLELGCEVAGPTARVRQALDILENKKVDLAILDVNLGSETSYPVAERLALLNVPFIFSTGHTTVAKGFEGRPRLQKPFSRRQLAACLSDLMKGDGDSISGGPQGDTKSAADPIR